MISKSCHGDSDSTCDPSGLRCKERLLDEVIGRSSSTVVIDDSGDIRNHDTHHATGPQYPMGLSEKPRRLATLEMLHHVARVDDIARTIGQRQFRSSRKTHFVTSNDLGKLEVIAREKAQRTEHAGEPGYASDSNAR